MPNYFQQLDLQLSQLRNAFLMDWRSRDFSYGVHSLFALNLALYDHAVEDMPQFKVKSENGNRAKPAVQAYSYVINWWPQIEAQLGLVRSEELAKFTQL